MGDHFVALDPRSDPSEITRVPLAPRPATLDGLRIALVQTMPPGSGLEPIIEALAADLAERHPSVRSTHVMRRNFMMTDLAEIAEVAEGFDGAVLVAGPAATMVHLAIVFADGLEQRGCPTALIHFDALTPSVDHSLGTVGASLRTFAIPNPPRTDDVTLAAVRPVIDSLTVATTDAETRTGVRPPPTRPRVATSGSLAEVNDYFHAQGWTDGLPVIPPTEEAVAAMLAGTSRRPDEIVTETFRPEGRRVTVEMVAITAVMAGATPAALPVILAAASVYGDLQFESMTRSVNSFAFAHLVSGPIAAEVGMTGGMGALGPGNRANVSVGRAIALLQRTVGGARTGVNTTPTQGSAMALSMAFAEHESASPWAPFHVDHGFRADQSVVSVFLGGHAHHGNFYYEDLDSVAQALATFELPQAGALVMLSEKRAHLLAEDGWTKQAIIDRLHERATVRLGTFRASGFFPMMRGMIEGRGPSSAPAWPLDYLTCPDDDDVPGFPPGAIKVIVLGSDVSSLVQAWKLQHHRSVTIDDWR